MSTVDAPPVTDAESLDGAGFVSRDDKKIAAVLEAGARKQRRFARRQEQKARGVFDDDLLEGLGSSFVIEAQGTWAEPPDSVLLRILGFAKMPQSRDAVKQAFRERVVEAHPDLATYTEGLSRRAAEVAVTAKADVQELMWAKHALIRKTPVAVTSNGTSDASRFAKRDEPPWRVRREKRIEALRTTVDEHRARRHPNDLANRASVRGEAIDLIGELGRLDARWCGQCGQDLAPDEPVWRIGTEPRCRDCHGCKGCDNGTRCHWADDACVVCGRIVHINDQKLIYRIEYGNADVVCCLDHQREAKAERRRRARARRRKRKCEGCGETFTPKRSDGRFCGDACRQFAYRQRKREAVTS